MTKMAECHLNLTLEEAAYHLGVESPKTWAAFGETVLTVVTFMKLVSLEMYAEVKSQAEKELL